MAFSQLRPIDWSTFASSGPCDVPWVYYDLKSCAAITTLLSWAVYVMWRVRKLATASRRVPEYFSVDARDLRSVQSTESPISTVDVLEHDIVPVVLPSNPISLRSLLSSLQ